MQSGSIGISFNAIVSILFLLELKFLVRENKLIRIWQKIEKIEMLKQIASETVEGNF